MDKLMRLVGMRQFSNQKSSLCISCIKYSNIANVTYARCITASS